MCTFFRNSFFNYYTFYMWRWSAEQLVRIFEKKCGIFYFLKSLNFYCLSLPTPNFFITARPIAASIPNTSTVYQNSLRHHRRLFIICWYFLDPSKLTRAGETFVAAGVCCQLGVSEFAGGFLGSGFDSSRRRWSEYIHSEWSNLCQLPRS